MALPKLGLAGLCSLLCVTAQDSQDICLQGSACSKKNTKPLGFVQTGTVGGKNNMMENDEHALREDLVEKIEKEQKPSVKGQPGVKSNSEDGQLEDMRANPGQAFETGRGRAKASGGFSFVSVRGERRKVFAVPKVKRPSESNQDCTELINALEGKHEVSDILIVIKWICETDDIRIRVTELKNGCLYLPNNDQWQQFQDTVEHPNPWLFLDMMENSFIPREAGQKCPSEVSGLTANTTNGLEVEGCDVDGEPGLRSSAGGCIQTFTVAKTTRSNIHIRRAESLMALDPSWEELMERHGVGGLVKESLTEVMTLDKLQKLQQRGKALLSNEKAVEIPLKYFVCDAPGSASISNTVTDQMLTDNTKAMNDGFAGKVTCPSPSQYHADREDSKISFKQVSITRLEHSSCRHDCRLHYRDMVAHVVPREMGMIKIVVCSTTLLGMASFPTYPDDRRVLLIAPGTVPGGSTLYYNLGATLTHEMGHYLGVYHTFQGGCDGGGDHVSDTSAQSTPTEGCPSYRKSSCGSKDNIHNFMDYSFDKCLCSFTKGQVERIWGFMDSHMRDLQVPKPSPTPGYKCEWSSHPIKYSPGHAAGAHQKFGDLDEMKKLCMALGAEKCKAVTCHGNHHCRTGASTDLINSPYHSEETYLPSDECYHTTNHQGISVKIVEAKNLQHSWWWETPDLFVEMKIVGRASAAYTGTQHNEHHPKWNEYLNLPEYQKGEKLLFTVWEEDPMHNDEMGTTEIVPDCNGESDKVLTLSPQGSLTVKIRCGPYW